MPHIQAQFVGRPLNTFESVCAVSHEVTNFNAADVVRASYKALNSLSRIRMEFSKAQKKETEK